LVAFRQEFKERLKESPIYLLEHVLSLLPSISFSTEKLDSADNFIFSISLADSEQQI
jgi:hypothetical protein